MSPSEQEQHDVRGQELHLLELKISYLLRSGVIFSGILLTVGWLWMWFNGHDITKNFKDYNPHSLKETFEWALVAQDRALIMAYLGLIVLVGLPIVRVALTGVLFYKQKDFRLAMMAFAVFATLILSLFLGIDI